MSALSALKWVVEIIVALWPGVITLAGGAITVAIARLDSMTAGFGPLAWLAVFVLGAVVSLLVSWIALHLWQKFQDGKRIERLSAATGVNVLADRFVRQRLPLAGFFHPHYRGVSATFEYCELVGPGVIVIQNCHAIRTTTSNCQVVIVEPPFISPPGGATLFFECRFADTTFYDTTFLMSQRDLEHQVRQGFAANLRVISVGLKERQTPAAPEG